MTDEQTPPPPEENDELQELKELTAKHAQPVLIAVCAVLILAIGVNYFKSQRAQKANDAAEALFAAQTPAELQDWLATHGKADGALVARSRMAAALFADGDYQAALDVYSAMLQDRKAGGLRPVAQLGQAHCREALGQVREAVDGFSQFISQQGDHFLFPEAVLGKARCLEQLGEFDNARIVYEDFIAANPESDWLPRAEDLLKRLNRRLSKGAVVPVQTSVEPAVPVAVDPMPATTAVVETVETVAPAE